MAVILIGGEKGGTGKSTLATNLAIMRCMMGYDLLFIDTTIKQVTSAKFIARRNTMEIKPTPPCVQIKGKYLGSEIESLSSRYNDIIIEAGGFDSAELRAAMAAKPVSKFYSPLAPSEFDLETLETISELVYLSQAFNPALQANIIINKAPTHKKITLTEEAISLINSYEHLKCSNTILSYRVAYQYAANEGLSVVEFENQKIKTLPNYQAKTYSAKASMELCSLYKEVYDETFDKFPSLGTS